jgi:hypothetical protein
MRLSLFQAASDKLFLMAHSFGGRHEVYGLGQELSQIEGVRDKGETRVVVAHFIVEDPMKKTTFASCLSLAI